MKDLFEADTPDHEEWMWDQLMAYSAAGAGFEPKSLTNPNNIWLVKSAYQKAMRRGDTELALRMGAYLWGSDPEAAFRSLAVNIVEDIGPTVPGMLACSTVLTLKTVTKQFDPPRLFAGLTSAASDASAKTRGCCELALGWEAKFEVTSGLPPKFEDDVSDEWHLQAIAKGSHDGVLPLLAAEWVYFSTCVLRQRSKHGNTELLNKALSQIMAEFKESAFVADLMHSFERNVDRMNLAAVPVRRMIEAELGVIVSDDHPPAYEIRAGLPSYAYDMHTMQGKRAIKGLWNRMLDKYPELLEAVPDPEKGPGVFGACVFVIESGAINNRMRNSALNELKEYQDRWFIAQRGCVPTRWKEVVNMVRNNWDEFSELRKWSATV